ncbi:hypothetical protein [Sinomonas gamaensis]|jgi:hypothetical protein|uniref:hypothetical protein n=1 Tax=Sinomonas gamaensis TaxID=2565624 RepID=UPI001108ABB1|nr:hypothetical protein [Sinomonas gamaensis]
MTYYIEYTVPSEGGDADLPVNEQESGATIPLTEVPAEHVHTSELPARSAVLAASLDEAKEAAEEVISHSKATRAELFDDDADSLEAGSGRLVARYAEGEGWTNQ